MHKRKVNRKLAYYAKILIVVSITLLIYGIILDFDNDRRLLDPIKDVEVVQEEESTISITTSDGSEVVPGNTIVTTKDNEDSTKENTEKENNPSTTPSNSGGNTSSTPNSNSGNGSSTGNTSGTQNNTVTTPTPVVPTIDDTNNSLRTEIQNTYGVTVRYGNETAGYSVAGVSTTPISNSTTINSQLNRLKNALALYPSGMFQEIKNGGIPLTILLINSYSENSITGVTDSSYSYANISIAAVHPFEESFYHESYHYIERYLFKRGANFNSWDSLNPDGFSYGNVYNNLSYANTFSSDAPFVNNYAQTAAAEDRASTFEYMMASSKASCLNANTTVWSKAKYMALTMEAVLNSVNPGVTEYWERYL